MTTPTFAERHGLWTEEQRRQASEVARRLEAEGIASLRLSFADQHGILRGKTLMTAAGLALGDGCALTSTLLLKDTSHRTAFPVWAGGEVLGHDALRGAADFVLIPDPATFRVLPWAAKTGWMLCDIYFRDGTAVPLSTRQILRDQLATCRTQGYELVTGLEVEFHVFKRRDGDAAIAPAAATHPGRPPEVGLLAHGYQYLTETRYDEMEPVAEEIRRGLEPLALGLRSIEVEFGPGQLELTFNAADALKTADDMVLLRAAVKQICQRAGLHATFMCKPGLANVFASGWHLHQSLVAAEDGRNLFCAEDDTAISQLGRHYMGGLLAHAAAAAPFTTPTINGYKRYSAYALAPDRIGWGLDNRGTMLRVCGMHGDGATRIENRVGEPAANPYLYSAAQIAAGLDGIGAERDPGPPTDAPYGDDAAMLPASLEEAIQALRQSALYRAAFGEAFIAYICQLKEFEVARFQSEVTDWEMREYFSTF